ncbi:MFS transporter [Sphingobium sp. YR768]|uniref:MFS transporter n=1 Tax=Sphingobium sp. YR768 TaxID=1884365 RepID=UPI0008C01153|nr:MFS transporter [Sphingobium sp. YR768]SER54922.1 MFS transporter, AAHS family, 4-hydroxybenzoate transporter [Sphingobium sp. YR768]
MSGGIAMTPASSGGDAGAAGWSRLQILVVLLCALINALDGMDVMIIAYVAPALATDWQVSVQALGVLFSAGLVGMMIGCIVVAPFADIWGRRPTILLALVLMTVGALGCGLVGGLWSFALMRVVTGIGIGTLLASIAALVSEYAPAGRRSLAIGIFQAGYPVGAVLTGLVAILSIPAFGWQETMLGAGIISAILIPLVWICLPESVNFLETRQPAGALERINDLRGKLGRPALPYLAERPATSALPRMGDLLTQGRWRSTLTLWSATFLSFAVLYFITSWIPKLAVERGLDQGDAIWAGSIFNLGGVAGGLLIGWLAIRRPIGALIGLFFLACAALMILFTASLPLALLLCVACLLGMTLQGGFSGFYSLAAQVYPTSVRGAGIGWAVGIGRGGAVIGPMAGGLLLGAKLPLWLVFTCFAVPLCIAGVLAAITLRIGGNIIHD